MSARRKPPRLWLREAQRDAAGRITHQSVWYIKDGDHSESTGCGEADLGGASAALTDYLTSKQVEEASKGCRRADQVPVADVVALYVRDIANGHSRPKETKARLGTILDYLGDKMLSDVNGDACRAYAAGMQTDSAARRALEDFRAAIKHHRMEGKCSEVIEVTMPRRRPHRERWLTRSDAARLIWRAWRYRELQKGVQTEKRPRRHVARFILLALYTGTRAGPICEATTRPTIGRGWVDLERGVFYRRPAGKRSTKKKAPPVRLPERLLAHMRRWQRLGISRDFVIEYKGRAIKRLTKAFNAAVLDANLSSVNGKVTPHILRHTAATWLMQCGVDPWIAAGYLGMTVETLIHNYGHHHPDHLAAAREAFDHRSPSPDRHRMVGMEREQKRSNVFDIASKPKASSA
jgi:integrase